MDQQEVHPSLTAVQYAGPYIGEQEGGAAVVDKGQGTLRLIPVDLPGGVQVRHGFCPGGIAPHQPRQQRGGTDAAEMEQGAHKGGKERLEPPGKPQLQQQGDHHEEGEQGGDNGAKAQRQPILYRGTGKIGKAEQSPGKDQNRQKE